MPPVSNASEPNRRDNRRAALFVAAPVLLLVGGAVLLRGIQNGKAKNAQTPAALSTDDTSAFAVNPPSASELADLNAHRLQADETEAYDAAKKLVKAYLLHHAADATFPAAGHKPQCHH